MLPCSMQCEAGLVLPRIFNSDHLLRNRIDRELAELLKDLTDVLVRFRELFSSVHKLVDKRVFYDIYRPILGGFHPEGPVLAGVDAKMVEEHAAAQLEMGLLKVEEDGKVRTMAKGPSAGQSTMIILFDMFLGVVHGKNGIVDGGSCPGSGSGSGSGSGADSGSGAESGSGAGSCVAPAEDGEGEAGPFQREMINYMPAHHRQMVLDYAAKIEADGSVRTYVEGGGKARKKAPPLVRDAYHKCIHALRQFRAFHLGAPAPPLSPHARCCGSC